MNDIKKNLFNHVSFFTSLNPPRSYENLSSLNKASDYILNEFRKYKLHVISQPFTVGDSEYRNIIASYGDLNLPRVVIGAHYDVCGNYPGADDNASSLSALLEIGRLLSLNHPKLNYRIDLAAYTLEEPPFFSTEKMGSYVHAKSLYDGSIPVHLMISLEMIGYYSNEKDSQDYPSVLLKLFYPDTGNFISVVGRPKEKKFISFFRDTIIENSDIPVESLSSNPSLVGIDFSDHRNFWEFGYHAIMITDTAFYRNKNYHTESDTIETLDFEKMSEVVKGLYFTLLDME